MNLKRPVIILFMFIFSCRLYSGEKGGKFFRKPDILNPSEYVLIGIFGGVNYNMHSGLLYLYNGNLICNEFNKGKGWGGLFGFKGFFPLFEDLKISPRLFYETRSGNFDQTFSYPFLGINNTVEQVDFEDKLNVKYSNLGLDALVSYDFISTIIYCLAGPSFNYILSNNFEKTETIINPAGVKFLDGSTSKIILSGSQEIINSFQVSIKGGLGMNLPVLSSFTLNIEVLYGFPLIKTSKDNNWKTSNFEFTIGLLYHLEI